MSRRKKGPMGFVVYRASAALMVLASTLVLLAPSSRAEDLRVVATIKPVHALVSQVMDGLGTPALLVDGAASPHSFVMKPSDARALNDADVLVRVSPLVEPFTEKVVAALPKSVAVVTLAESGGITLLEKRTAATFEAHGHAGHAGNGHQDGHSHKGEHGAHKADEHGSKHADDDDDGHAEGTADGHIWLDPENARAIVKAVAAALAERRPDLAPRLEANAAKAVSAIDALDAELKAALAPAAGRPFIVFHDAYQYFERRYGLEAAGSITINPEVNPSAKRLSAIRAKVKSLQAACVFSEPQFSPRIIATITEGSTARAGVLDPVGANLKPGPDLYPTLLRDLARGFVDCLASRS